MLLNDYETKISNVCVVGCGGAGLRAAIEAKTQGLSVNIIGKRSRYDAHTVLAAGGINASLGNVDNNDSWQQHFADTFIEGYGISDPRTVEIMAKEAPDLVSEIDSWGANFARTIDNKIDQRFFGAHTYRRTCYAGDYTGRAILRTLLKKINKLDLSIDDTQYVSHVLVSNNVCFGAISIDMRNAKKILHLCDSLILSTGGHTRIWRKSSSRKAENTGDGMALALKVGCPLIDLEMVQFHPTGMLFPKNVEGYLVTEAVRGEGGQLFNSEGERFMSKYDPERLELSSRDRVALANYTEIMEGRSTPNGGVFLDISHKEKDFILEKLPTIYKQFIEHQMLDISKKPMEVAPTAHYSMGGIVVKPDDHSTNIKGLYACGEVSGGLHGANRLGGNSLAEILIFGKRAGIGAARYSKKLKNHIRDNHKVETAILEINKKIKKGSELGAELMYELENIMWKYCGVLRDEENLRIGLQKIKTLKKRFQNIDVRIDSESCDDLILAFELESALLTAEATILSSINRKESRGAHQRRDYPKLNKKEKVNYRVSLHNNKFLVEKKDVNKLNPELREVVENTKSINDISKRLLE